jgi:MerR family transcriptional regulator, redox-sensitive transcriptional activator SoxR
MFVWRRTTRASSRLRIPQRHGRAFRRRAYELKCALGQARSWGGRSKPVSSMSIGQVARICGLAPSAIRYYEKAGLLPKPIRVSRQRRYDAEIIGRLRLLQVARQAGFSIAETRTFVAGFSATTPPAIRWRTLAERKLAELEAQMARLRRMKLLLESSFHCHCLSIEDCARIIGEASPAVRTRSRPGSRKARPVN